MTLNLSQKEIEAWQQFVYDTTPGIEKAVAGSNGQPVTINITFNVDNSVNVQSVITAASIPVNMVDERPRLTKEKRALLGPWQEYAGYTG